MCTFGPSNYAFTGTFAADGMSFAGSDPWGGFTAAKSTSAIVRVLPAQAILKVGSSLPLDGVPGGVYDKRLAWSATGGSIDGQGVYTAPAVPGVHRVTASSVAQPTAKAEAIISKAHGVGISVQAEAVHTDKGQLTRLRAGPYGSREIADKAHAKLASGGISSSVVGK